MKQVVIYTDGACSGNPGRGGYGVVLKCEGRRKELSQGYVHTTNNRMEIMAAIAGLEALKCPCQVILYSDSKYLVDAINQGWLQSWQKKGWKRDGNKPVKNVDLFEKLVNLLDIHKVEFRWVKGHAGNEENEICDRLAQGAANARCRLTDLEYVGSLSD